MWLSRLWPTTILLSAIAACIVAFTMPGTVVALVVILWFLFMCPGMAVVRFMRMSEAVVEWTLAVAVGLSIDAIVAGIFLYGHIWSPPAILITLVVFSIAGAIGQLVIIRPGYMAQEEAVEQLETVEIPSFVRLLEQEETREVVSVARLVRNDAIEEKATAMLVSAALLSREEHIEDQETRVMPRMPVAREGKVAMEEKKMRGLSRMKLVRQPDRSKKDIEEEETSMLPSAGLARQPDESKKDQDGNKKDIGEEETRALPSAGSVRQLDEMKESKEGIEEKETSALPRTGSVRQPDESKESIGGVEEKGALPSAEPIQRFDESKEDREEKETSALPDAETVRQTDESKEAIEEKETRMLPLTKDAEHKRSVIEEKKAKEMSPVAAASSGRIVGRPRPVRYKRIEPEQ